MDKVLDKLGIYDLFSMLIPGIMFMIILWYLDPGNFLISKILKLNGATLYFVFLIVSYFVGITLHELGIIIDGNCFYKNGSLRKIFLEENIVHGQGTGNSKIITNKVDFQLYNKIKNDILEELSINQDNVLEYDKNSFVFSYCMNYLEITNQIGKADKIKTVSEMSRSLSLALFINAIIYGFYGYGDNTYFVKLFILMILCIIFYIRKKRFDEHRIQNLMRVYAVLKQKSQDSENI